MENTSYRVNAILAAAGLCTLLALPSISPAGDDEPKSIEALDFDFADDSLALLDRRDNFIHQRAVPSSSMYHLPLEEFSLCDERIEVLVSEEVIEVIALTQTPRPGGC